MPTIEASTFLGGYNFSYGALESSMKSPIWILMLLIVGAACAFGGYQYSQSLADAESANQSITKEEADSTVDRIVGQGNLQPARGTINIVAPPGERIEQLLVKVGQTVKNGEPLVVLASQKVREIELELAESRKSDADAKAAMLGQANQIKADSASIAGSEVKEALAKVENQKGAIAALEKSVRSAEKMLGKLKGMRANPVTRELVGEVEIQQQEGVVLKLSAQLEQATGEIEIAKQGIERSREMANAQLKLAELNVAAPEKSVPTRSLNLAIKAAKLALDSTTIKSPVKGRVLDLSIYQGDTVMNRPIMLIADTTKMVCIAEITDTQLKHVKPGQSVKMLSDAFDDGEITGSVLEIGNMIAPPSMKNPNPFAAVDRKTGTVKIEIDSTHSEMAGRFVNLQVEVRISKTKEEETASGKNAEASKSTADKSDSKDTTTKTVGPTEPVDGSMESEPVTTNAPSDKKVEDPPPVLKEGSGLSNESIETEVDPILK